MPNPIKLKRHNDQLGNAIDELAVRGWTKLSKDILRSWYDQERMSKTIWRDIENKIPEFLKDNGVTVFDYQDEVLLIETGCTSDLKELT